MPTHQGPPRRWSPVQLIDRLASKIIGAMHNLFGFQFSRNTEHFIYQVTILHRPAAGAQLALGSTFTGAIRFTQESDFVCTRINISTRQFDLTAGVTNGGHISNSAEIPVAGDGNDVPITIRLQDGSTDRQLSNEEVDAWLAYGGALGGGLPGVLSKPRLFARNATLTVNGTALKRVSGGVNGDGWDIRVQLHGWKIYDAGSLDLTGRRA